MTADGGVCHLHPGRASALAIVSIRIRIRFGVFLEGPIRVPLFGCSAPGGSDPIAESTVRTHKSAVAVLIAAGVLFSGLAALAGAAEPSWAPAPLLAENADHQSDEAEVCDDRSRYLAFP